MKKYLFIGIAVLLIVAITVGCIFLLWPDDGDAPEEKIRSGHTEFVKNIRAEYGYSEDRDSDGDTLNDYEEQYTYRTDAFHCDTDSDGLYDNRELELRTDPLDDDTDKDGVQDGTEVRAGTDPLTADSDQEFDLTLTVGDDTTATFVLSGDARIYEATLQLFDATGLSNTPGILSDAYWVYSPGKQKGMLTIHIGPTEQEVSIYKLNNDLSYTKVDTDIEETGEGLALTTKAGNGKYLAGVCSFLDDVRSNTDAIDVFLLLDDSGSMYDEQMDGQGSDPNYQRVEMCRQLLDNASKEIRFGLATFTADYMEKSPITDDRDEMLTALDTIQDTPHADKVAQFNGTFISTSVYHALDNFSADNPRRQILVLLTDGATTEYGFDAIFRDTKSIESTLAKANERNVSIVVVALGHSVDVTYLTNIESATDGAYIHANSADAMEDLYAAILDAVNLNFIDTDDDGENDSLMVADSGFRPEVNGLPIRNPIVLGEGFRSAGMCYGFSTFCSLYYQQKLPTSLDDMDITDWNLWYIRPLFEDNPEVLQPYNVPGFTVDDFKMAGFDVDNSGKLTYSSTLGEWASEVMDRYLEYFQWPYDSEWFEEIPLPDGTPTKVYTLKAQEILASEDYMVPAYIDTCSYPGLDLTVDEGELSGDSLETLKLLRILMRYQISQYSIATTENYTYKFAADFATIDHALTSGIPLVLCTSDHAVNVCRMRQDLENPNLYYLDLYDSNYCGTGTTMTAEIKNDADGNKYTEYQYGNTFTDVTFYDPHF